MKTLAELAAEGRALIGRPSLADGHEATGHVVGAVLVPAHLAEAAADTARRLAEFEASETPEQRAARAADVRRRLAYLRVRRSR